MKYQYAYCDWLVSRKELNGYLKLFNIAEVHKVSICVIPTKTPDEYYIERIIIRFYDVSEITSFKEEISEILTFSAYKNIDAESFFVEAINLNSHPYNIRHAIEKALIEASLWNEQLDGKLI